VKSKTGIALSLTTIVVLALATTTMAQTNAFAITPYWQGRYNGEANGKADNRDGFSYGTAIICKLTKSYWFVSCDNLDLNNSKC